MIFGAIGYSILGNSTIFPNVEIMLISDQHDEPSTSCKSEDGKIIPSILISDYLRKLILNGYVLLLEEIPYSGELVGLWEDSIHVASTRKLYLDSLTCKLLKNKIIPFDIRLEIIKNLDKKFSDEQILSNYIYNINQFCILKYEYIKCTIYSKNIDKSILGKCYHDILYKFYYFIKNYKKYLYNKIKDIPNKHELYDTIEILISDIMEFYCIATIYDLIINNKNKIVINCGLYHIEKLEKLLCKYYKFNVLRMYGTMSMNDIHKIKDICIEFPESK
jgi:hypothetical protein